MEVDTLYQEIILDHYKRPHGRGLRVPYGAEVHHVNPTCGDEITLRVELTGDDIIADISYEGQGCSISQASASILYEQLLGLPLAEARAIQRSFLELLQGRGTVQPDEDVLGDGIAFAGVAKYPARVKCALLSWLAWQDAVLRVEGERSSANE
jgi:nitrogen fixation NifU-like protein